MSKRVDMVYAGGVRHRDAIGHAYFVVTDGGISERATVFEEPLGDSSRVGIVCSYLVSRDGARVQHDEIKYVGVYDDDALIQEWQARHSSIEAADLAWSARELPKEFACLDPIRDAYRQVDDEQRAMLLMQVGRYIITGK